MDHDFPNVPRDWRVCSFDDCDWWVQTAGSDPAAARDLVHKALVLHLRNAHGTEPEEK